MLNSFRPRHFIVIAFYIFALANPGGASAQSTETSPVAGDDWNVIPPGAHYSMSLLGGYAFAADSHGSSGSVSKTYFGGELGAVIPVDNHFTLGLDALAGGVAYRFRGPAGLFPGEAHPWGTILTQSLGAGITYHDAGSLWTVNWGAAIYSAGEDGAIYGDTLSGGANVTVQYAWSPQLTIGASLGILSRLDANPYVIPFPVINWILPWDDQHRWRLKIGETQVGPSETVGATLAFSPSRHWTFTAAFGGVGLGGEFRLDHDGPVPGGIGRASAYPLVLGLTWHPIRPFEISAFAGANTFATIDDIDRSGNRVGRQNLDAAPIIGLNGSISF